MEAEMRESGQGARAPFAPGFLVVAMLAGACAAWACGSAEAEDGGGGGGASGSDGKKFFVEKVYTSVNDACKDCHQSGKSGAPVFLGASGDASYTAIEGFPGLISAPSVSPIVQKGVHSGPALTATQTDLVTQWLKLELNDRKLGSDPGAPKNLRAAFKAFGQCMDFARWTELKLDTIPLSVTEGNQGQCQACHNYGQASMWLSANEGETFLKMREFPYVQRLVVGRVNAEGAFDGIEASRRMLDKGTEAQQPQSNSHPRYALSADLAGNLNTYVLETISNMNANRCQNVTIPDAGPDATR
jgi:hypothetical protein